MGEAVLTDTPLETALWIAERMEDAELFELHREVSRLASRARLRDPVYVAHQRTGYNAARQKMDYMRRARSPQP